MKFSKFFLLPIIALFIQSCCSLEDRYPIDKRYWDIEDYSNVIRELRFGIEPDEKIPGLSTPETRIVFEKLVDEQNYKVVLDDEELGLKYRSEVATDFFSKWKDMSQIYRTTDRKDQYVYDRELIKVFQFGLGLQLRYFKLGNDLIIENADDPNSGMIQRTIRTNVETMISNFNIYLDEINNEDAYSEEGKRMFTEGIDTYFSKLIDQHPDANYSSMEHKIELMKKKSGSQLIKKSLENLSQKIQEKKEQV